MKNWLGEGSKDLEEAGVKLVLLGIPASAARFEVLTDRFDCITYRELNAFLHTRAVEETEAAGRSAFTHGSLALGDY
jgi:hypothetical protein